MFDPYVEVRMKRKAGRLEGVVWLVGCGGASSMTHRQDHPLSRRYGMPPSPLRSAAWVGVLGEDPKSTLLAQLQYLRIYLMSIRTEHLRPTNGLGEDSRGRF